MDGTLYRKCKSKTPELFHCRIQNQEVNDAQTLILEHVCGWLVENRFVFFDYRPCMKPA